MARVPRPLARRGRNWGWRPPEPPGRTARQRSPSERNFEVFQGFAARKSFASASTGAAFGAEFAPRRGDPSGRRGVRESGEFVTARSCDSGGTRPHRARDDHRFAEPGDLQLDEAGGRIGLAARQHFRDDASNAPHAAPPLRDAPSGALATSSSSGAVRRQTAASRRKDFLRGLRHRSVSGSQDVDDGR